MTDEEFDRQMYAEGRRRCPICQQWTPVTKAKKLRVHKRQDPKRWHMVPCDGSGHAPDTAAALDRAHNEGSRRDG